jgi:polyketide synthase 13
MSNETSELRDWLRQSLARALNRPIEDVSDDSDFLSLGLPSLEAVVLAGELEDFLGRPVDANLLLDHPSIARLAAALASEPVDA